MSFKVFIDIVDDDGKCYAHRDFIVGNRILLMERLVAFLGHMRHWFFNPSVILYGEVVDKRGRKKKCVVECEIVYRGGVFVDVYSDGNVINELGIGVLGGSNILEEGFIFESRLTPGLDVFVPGVEIKKLVDRVGILVGDGVLSGKFDGGRC
jgi:hypothetical protein